MVRIASFLGRDRSDSDRAGGSRGGSWCALHRAICRRPPPRGHSVSGRPGQPAQHRRAPAARPCPTPLAPLKQSRKERRMAKEENGHEHGHEHDHDHAHGPESDLARIEALSKEGVHRAREHEGPFSLHVVGLGKTGADDDRADAPRPPGGLPGGRVHALQRARGGHRRRRPGPGARRGVGHAEGPIVRPHRGAAGALARRAHARAQPLPRVPQDGVPALLLEPQLRAVAARRHRRSRRPPGTSRVPWRRRSTASSTTRATRSRRSSTRSPRA